MQQNLAQEELKRRMPGLGAKVELQRSDKKVRIAARPEGGDESAAAHVEAPGILKLRRREATNKGKLCDRTEGNLRMSGFCLRI